MSFWKSVSDTFLAFDKAVSTHAYNTGKYIGVAGAAVVDVTENVAHVMQVDDLCDGISDGYQEQRVQDMQRKLDKMMEVSK